MGQQFATECQYHGVKTTIRRPDNSQKLLYTKGAKNIPPQKPTPERRHNTKFGGHLINLNESIEQIPKNLNYHCPLGDWIEFYQFPKGRTANKYIDEIKALYPSLKKFSVVNEGFDSMRQYADTLIELNKRDRCGVTFLEGTTGVGKTTFLKYFVKSQKVHFLNSKNIISRIKFDDVEKLYLARRAGPGFSLQSAFSKLLIDKLFRDIVDSYVIFSERQNLPQQTYKAFINRYNYTLTPPNEAIQDSLKAIHNKIIRTIINNTEFDLERFNADLKSNPDVLLSKFLPDEKREIIEATNKLGFKFCIVLDGFDALRPEDIAIFHCEKQSAFSECLKSVIDDAVDPSSTNGELVKSLDKAYLIAARPVTILEMKKNNPETSFDTYLDKLPPSFIIGSDVFELLRKRIKLRIKQKLLPPPHNELFSALEAGLMTILNVIYHNHKNTVTPGRFIDLFNHNIREKLIFLKNAIQYLVIKAEDAFYIYLRDAGIYGSPKLALKRFSSIMRYSASDLKIELYEVHKLLLLPETGIYLNKFDYASGHGPLVYQSGASAFENIFNYLPLSERSNIDEVKKSNWELKFDPILIKFEILRYLKINTTETIETVSDWLKNTYKYHQFEDCDLKTMIRADLIRPTLLGGKEVLLNCTNKGIFVLDELTCTNIYIEHVLVNAKVPVYVSNQIKCETTDEQRVWALKSMVNTVVFFQYLLTVANEMETDESTGLTERLNEIFSTLSNSFGAIAAKGVDVDDNYSNQARTHLDRFENRLFFLPC